LTAPRLDRYGRPGGRWPEYDAIAKLLRIAHISELPRIPLDAGVFLPVRRQLGVTAFGVNAYTAAKPGDELVERHDETSVGAGRHEELYVVLTGRASFEVDGERVDAPAGTMLMVEPGIERFATAAEPDTTVLVVGGRPGSGLPVSPFEYWYAAIPAEQAGDYDRAYEIAAEGLKDYPDHGTLHYALACFSAGAGRREEALSHLRTAFERDPRTREWAKTDSDLEGLRDDPDYPDQGQRPGGPTGSSPAAQK
jgi:tetratricopeptide (TPR) repeat protein